MIGKEVVFIIGEDKIKGVVVDITSDDYLVENTSAGKSFQINIPKGKVSYYITEINPEKNVESEVEKIEPVCKPQEIPIDRRVIVLACQQDGVCTGIRYLRSGVAKDSVEQHHYNDFIADCPKRCNLCKIGIMGYLDELSADRVEEVADHIMVGDYPKRTRGRPKKEEKKSE